MISDKIIIEPKDIDLSKSPLRKTIKYETFVLGAFNPALSRLPNGNLILMVRVAEALKKPIVGQEIMGLRWDAEKSYCVDKYPLDQVDISDPRVIILKKYLPTQVLALTSISWILPVELDAKAQEVVHFHYDKIISAQKSFQEYGVEDPRLSLIDGKYYMTTCSVSSERQNTTLYSSQDGLNYKLEGVVLDHQNKDMLLFEGKVNKHFYALTRPLGDVYFNSPPHSNYLPGPSINMAQSPDSLHWKPCDNAFIRSPRTKEKSLKIGGGSPPILTEQGWLILFHGVEKNKDVGAYKTYWALSHKDRPWELLYVDMNKAVLEANPLLTKHLEENIYLTQVVFTTGILAQGEEYIIASGELDLCCRITKISKDYFLQ
ncbi:MAG: glycosidase [Bacteroidetes bacterium 4572_77]|nr:MAG: glycosidase [Bacteroidetes bacterium 4572_77]